MKTGKKSLLASGVSLLASAALLAGATFAWFTDSVTNTGNKIESGKLAINAYAYDLAADGTQSFTIEGVNGGEAFAFEATPQDLKTDKTPIIDDTLFEPGKSNAKLLKVENAGTLAAKIKLNFTVEDGGLMDALWFDFVQVKGGAVVGTFQKRPMSELETIADGMELPLLANENVQFILVYGMDESAGNAFMEKTFSADVAIVATQYTEEKDGFGSNQYDKDAAYAWTGDTDDEGLEDNTDADTKTVSIETPEQLAAFAAAVNAGENTYAGYTIKLEKDVDLSGHEWTPISSWGGKLNGTVIDGQGHSIRNMTVSGVNEGGFISSNASSLTIRDLTFEGARVTTNEGSQKYAGVVMGKNYSKVTFERVVVRDSQVVNTWQCGGFVGFAEGNAPGFVDCVIEDSFVGGKNATGGTFFGLGIVDVALTGCSANTVQLYTDSLTWNTTAKQEGNFFVGHLYGKALTTEGCTETNVTVVSAYPEGN